MEGAPACPFVAFADDRESRAASPDHRHRCYAELVPSPRAAAHQEAYCLSSAFPVCPTFQDWAKREAARAAVQGERPRPAPAGSSVDADRDSDADPAADEAVSGARREDRSTRYPPEEPAVRRNPPRDWAAPPPWAPGGSGTGSTAAARRTAGTDRSGPPDFLADRADESRGLAGSAADRLASPSSPGGPSSYDIPVAAEPDDDLADLVGGRRPVDRPTHGYPPSPRAAARPSVSSTRSANRDRERERDVIVGPSWERSRRFEAYPTIRSRGGLPQLPRLAVLAVALVIAAIGLFFLPALLGVGGGGGTDTPTAQPSASSGVASASPEPTASAAPSAQVYIVKAGDTMSKIAAAFGFTPEELCTANQATITDCDKIAVGDEITIPAKAPDEFTEPSAQPS
jgi:hypothetical protein